MRRSLVGLLVVLALSAGCGNGGTLEPSALSGLRVYNASPDSPPVDIFVKGSVVTQGLSYGFGRLGIVVVPGAGLIEVRNTATDDVLLDYSATLAAGTPYTFAFTGTAGALQPIFVADDTTAAPSGSFKVRMIHLAPLGPPMDLYITGASDDLATATPAITGLAYTKISNYVTAPVGTQRLRLTQTGTKTVLREVGTFPFTSGQGVTLLVIGNAGTGGGGAPYSGQLVADHS